jgi:MbtH protein
MMGLLLAAKIASMLAIGLFKARRATDKRGPRSENVPTNPFEDENGVYHVLVNSEGQYSLWPSFVTVPEGWTIAHTSDNRAACLEFIEKNWTDMRPNSLIKTMNEMSKNKKRE